MIAVARGRGDATWIASATLDRYLHAIGRPQVLGTQYAKAGDEPWTQEPYDRKLLSDPLRAALGVPPRDEQARRLVEMNLADTPARSRPSAP